MLRFGEREIAKEKFYEAKIPIKSNSKYLTGYLDKDIRPLVLVMPKMIGYVDTFKVRDKNIKLMSFRIDNEKLFETYKIIWINIENFNNFEWNALPVYDERYIKPKIRPNRDKFYTNFRGLNVPEGDIEYESFTVIFINSLPSSSVNTALVISVEQVLTFLSLSFSHFKVLWKILIFMELLCQFNKREKISLHWKLSLK